MDVGAERLHSSVQIKTEDSHCVKNEEEGESVDVKIEKVAEYEKQIEDKVLIKEEDMKVEIMEEDDLSWREDMEVTGPCCIAGPGVVAAQPSHSPQLRRQSKEIIFRVSQYFQKEKQNGGVLEHITRAVRRTAAATHLSAKTVTRICKEAKDNQGNHSPKFRSPKKKQRSTPILGFFDNFNESVLHRTVLQFYVRKEIPTLEKIQHKIKNNLSYPGCLESLRKILKKIGFWYVNVNGRKFLLERNDLTYARCKFLREMRSLSSSDKNIVYLGEHWLDQNYTASKCRVNQNAGKAVGVRVHTGKRARLMVMHAGTKHGFIPGAALIFQTKNVGDSHDQMNAETFEKWFQTQLLPNIPPSSVIVMDDASYHCRKIQKVPTATSKKAAIREWLEKKGVTVPEGLLRAELLHLVTRHITDSDANYVVDKAASEQGHRVVRLPPYHCRYNPIELIWVQVKGYISKRNTLKIAELKQLVHEAINNVTRENWSSAVKHTEKLQAEDAEGDVAMDHYIDSLPVTSDDSDSSSDEDSVSSS